ncbi:TetR/AcrR family transcriptional regulator [Agromyces seonyuensis]|uniref:TetR family transcriptional regulator n=1 Tax=Agromyces seonyuensis TaxID=2662446 RepID=A0A6I4NWR6_9MICO|nr:TetR/AcrR family transcriptional regulator [Agromyces seonyuensis]MWB98720.1 TetR family transcriptional regulator [Agromyces seonyuensis]
MARWERDAPGRLARAALELFGERGYEQTTVAAIAERAGVTERTFFRHYADKREVLFDGSNALQQVVVASVAEAPASAEPADLVGAAVAAGGALLAERRDFARQRAAVIAAEPGLQERELLKLERMTAAVAEALRARGIADVDAELLARAGVAAFHLGFARWLVEEGDGLDAGILAAYARLRRLVA